jgi:hypothetical protein
MNALLPYLKQIADAIGSSAKNGGKKRDEELTSIAKNINTASVTNNNVSMAGNENTKGIRDTLAKGLIVTVHDGSSEYEKSIFALMFEMLQQAMFVTVTENGQQVTKGIAQLLHDISTALGTTNTTLASINTNTSRTASRLSTVNENLGTTNNLLGDIESNTDNIHVTAELDDSGIIDALKGNNQRSVVDAIIYADNYSVLSDIKDNTDSIENHVASIDSKTPNPNS